MDGAYIITETFYITVTPRGGPVVRMGLKRDEVEALLALLQELLRRADAGVPVSFE